MVQYYNTLMLLLKEEEITICKNTDTLYIIYYVQFACMKKLQSTCKVTLFNITLITKHVTITILP